MIYIHKIVGIIFSLSYISIILIVLSIIKNIKWLTYTMVCTLVFFSTQFISNKLMHLLEQPEIRKTPDEVSNADAVVVLGGMLGHTKTNSGNTFEWNDPDRFFGGIELIKSKRAKYLVFMGTKLPWTNAKLNDGQILKKYSINFGIHKDSILITDEVESTEAEAKAVNKLFKNKRIKILLVTSAFHMKRAKIIFEKAGFLVETYPVDFRTNDDKTSILAFMPTIGSLAQSEFALRELLGIMIYTLKR